MPVKDIQCNECKYEFERRYLSYAMFRLDLEERQIRCPSCSSNDVEQVISLPAPARFKGSGFYSTDYGKGS
jgi:predicted nucleic acid-binding Zn ribbon protein